MAEDAADGMKASADICRISHFQGVVAARFFLLSAFFTSLRHTSMQENLKYLTKIQYKATHLVHFKACRFAFESLFFHSKGALIQWFFSTDVGLCEMCDSSLL